MDVRTSGLSILLVTALGAAPVGASSAPLAAPGKHADAEAVPAPVTRPQPHRVCQAKAA